MNKMKFSIKELLEAGVHYGHKKNFWNPKMARYIHSTRNGMHIINLEKTYVYFIKALEIFKNIISQNGKILFIGTKKHSSHIIEKYAKKCKQYYINYRWLPGMLTNRITIQNSINKLKEYEKIINNKNSNLLKKKEKRKIIKKYKKLELALGGIKELNNLPNLLFIINTKENNIAVKEAKKLSIPIVGIVDTNTSIDEIDYIIPGNDDSKKSIELYCKITTATILEEIEKQFINHNTNLKEK